MTRRFQVRNWLIILPGSSRQMDDYPERARSDDFAEWQLSLLDQSLGCIVVLPEWRQENLSLRSNNRLSALAEGLVSMYFEFIIHFI
jgi:hypothetical protein